MKLQATDMLLRREKFTEYHQNGEKWITGEIGLVAELWKHLYNYRTNFEGYEGKPICRLGLWHRYYDNGQLAWTIEYDEHGYPKSTEYPSFRMDGSLINY